MVMTGARGFRSSGLSSTVAKAALGSKATDSTSKPNSLAKIWAVVWSMLWLMVILVIPILQSFFKTSGALMLIWWARSLIEIASSMRMTRLWAAGGGVFCLICSFLLAAVAFR